MRSNNEIPPSSRSRATPEETNKRFMSEYNKIKDSLSGFAMKLCKDKITAEDLNSETLSKALEKINTFKPDSNFKARITTIMYNSFVNDCRKKKTRQSHAKDIQDTFATSNKLIVPATVDSDIALQEIMKHVQELDDMHKVPFMMFHEGYQYKEIAEEMDISLGTVKSRIYNAKKQLQKTLGSKYKTTQGNYLIDLRKS